MEIEKTISIIKAQQKAYNKRNGFVYSQTAADINTAYNMAIKTLEEKKEAKE